MTNVHYPSGLSEHQWVMRLSNEARSDPVGLWQIVKVGRTGFNLQKDELVELVRRIVVELLREGAVPLVGDASMPFGWRHDQSLGVDPVVVADAIVSRWIKSGVDPDVSDAWFAFPSAF